MLREEVGPDDAVSAQEFDQFVAERRFVKELAMLRSLRELTQNDIAELMGHTQSWVSKFENSRDDELTIGDVRKYLDAIGLEFRPGAVKKGATTADEIKHLAFAIKRRLNKLAELAKEGDGLVEHIASLFANCFYSLNRFLSDAAAKLPNGADGKRCISITLETELLDDCDSDDEVAAQCRQHRSDEHSAAALN